MFITQEISPEAGRRSIFGSTALKGTLLAVVFAMAHTATAQTPVIIGYPANFDAYNNTGEPTHGFEIEADGIDETQVTRVFGGFGNTCYIRYCAGTVTPFAGGVKIRWTSPYDAAAHAFTLSTPLPGGIVGSGESCWTLGLGARYPAAGCEHFGISTTVNPTRVVYRWLVEDAANPGQLVYFAGASVPIPQPVVNVVPPAVAGGAPVVEFNVALPVPPPPPIPKPVPQLGDAQWVKVYKLELQHVVDLNDLMGGNAAVPEAPLPAETEWQLMQYDPTSHSKRNAFKSRGGLGNGSKAVVRRYEHYKYTGKYDPLNHAVICGGDRLCTAPLAGELGAMIGAQNAAANLVVPSVSVTSVGGGTVTSADALIQCGKKCFATYAAGSHVALTAVAPKNAVFTGWSGACAGKLAGCNLVVSDAVNVTATFVPVYTLQVALNGTGLVLGTPYGEAPSFISCGLNCTATFQSGTVVTLTASPVGTQKFKSWGGSCAGTNPVCKVAITSNTRVQAVFK